MNKNEQIDSTKCFFISSHVNPLRGSRLWVGLGRPALPAFQPFFQLHSQPSNFHQFFNDEAGAMWKRVCCRKTRTVFCASSLIWTCSRGNVWKLRSPAQAARRESVLIKCRILYMDNYAAKSTFSGRWWTALDASFGASLCSSKVTSAYGGFEVIKSADLSDIKVPQTLRVSGSRQQCNVRVIGCGRAT